MYARVTVARSQIDVNRQPVRIMRGRSGRGRFSAVREKHSEKPEMPTFKGLEDERENVTCGTVLMSLDATFFLFDQYRLGQNLFRLS